MTKKRKLKILISFLLGVCGCFAGCLIYINSLNNAINSSQLQNMIEMSEHDLKNIENSLENSWEKLEDACERLTLYQVESIVDLQYYLNIECASSSFDMISLLDGNGFLYTAGYPITDINNNPYVKKILNEENKIVMWYDDFTEADQQRETILYGTRIKPFTIGDATFVAAIGLNDIKHIDNTLKIDSFGGNGYTSVIDKNGYYIVQQSGRSNTADRSNFFEWFRKGTFAKNESADMYIQKIRNGETFHFTYVNADNIEKLITFMPIPDTDWYLFMNIPVSVLHAQTRSFVFSTILLLSCISLVIILLTLLLWRTRIISLRVKAQARAKSEFLSSMSHEIRTPLNGLLGLNHLMKQNIDDKARITDYLQKSDAAAKYLLALINDILDISKLSDGHVELLALPFSLPQAMDSIETMFHDRMDDKNLHLETDYSFISPYIVGDEMRLKQVLINIISNAVKFTPENGRISVAVKQEPSINGAITTSFQIADTGCGMSREFLEHIFESFTQERAPQKVSNASEGTGLGMSISRMIIQQMGGTITVKSELGVGSCFTVNVTTPAAEEPQEAADTPVSKQQENASLPKLNILVVEDVPLNAEILSEILLANGFTVDLAENGQIAVEKVVSSDPYTYDVILMDCQMPIMNGFEAANAIRALNRPDVTAIKIFACTANIFTEDQQRASKSGMDGFLSKPIDIAVLMNMLQ